MYREASLKSSPEAIAWDFRVSTAISVARVVLMFGIVTGHAMLQNDFFSVYAPGVAYPSSPNGLKAFVAGLAAQTSGSDRVAWAGGLTFWSLNFAFYALSGFSMWYQALRRGTFSLRDYFFSRFFGIYLGFAAAAITAFLVVVIGLGHHPGEHDLNFLLLGVARAKETMDYNDTLWFLTVLFGLYLIFPAIPVLYRFLRLPGLIALWGLFTWMRARGILVNYTFLPTAFSFFLLGVLAADVLHRLRAWNCGPWGSGFLTAGAAILAGDCLVHLYGLAYVDLLASGSVNYDTHAIGTSMFLLLVALGLLVPAGPRLRFGLRLAGRGTFAVYVYHYLLFRLYDHLPCVHNLIQAVILALPQATERHFLLGAGLLYAVLLTVGIGYQAAFDCLIIGPLRRFYDKPISLK